MRELRSTSLLLVLLAPLLIPSCRSGESSGRDPLSAAGHLARADSLERRDLYSQAMLEYLLVAQMYPSSREHPQAVLKTALLYSNPRNPTLNDSLAAHWFEVYRDRYADTDEAEMVALYAGLNDRIRMLRGDLRRQTASLDSLAAVSRRQSAELGARSRRIQELEADLAKTQGELKRLREIDLQMRRRTGK
jgi:TolA-binding protein